MPAALNRSQAGSSSYGQVRVSGLAGAVQCVQRSCNTRTASNRRSQRHQPAHRPQPTASVGVVLRFRSQVVRLRMVLRAVTAAWSALGRVWRYFWVVVMEEWPMRSLTTCMSAPPARSQEAWA
jgi:hypothetical protein